MIIVSLFPSFHYINSKKKKMISAGLKKVISKKNIKGSGREKKFMSQSWVVIRCLPFLPILVARSLIQCMIDSCGELPLSNNQIAFSNILIGIQDDHRDENKLQSLNWWNLIQNSSQFRDSTTAIVIK